MATKKRVSDTERQPPAGPVAAKAASKQAGGTTRARIEPRVNRNAAIIQWVGRVIALAMLLSATIVIVILVIADAPTRKMVFDRAFGIGGDEEAASWHTPGGKELTSSLGVHFFIAEPIAKCFKLDLTKSTVPLTAAGTLMLGLQPNGSHKWSSWGFNKDNPDPEPLINLNNYQLYILSLSDSIQRARMQAAEIAASSRSLMAELQLLLIAVGAITTIFISIKSILPANARGFRAVGIAAVIFSALGTACSGAISFYNPSEAFARSDRALAQLRQLHTDLSLAAANSTDLCTPLKDETDARAKALKELSTRYSEIANAPGTSGGQNPSGRPGGTTGPATGAGAAPSQGGSAGSSTGGTH